MRRILLLAALWATPTLAVPLSTIGSFCGLFPDQCRKGSQALMAVRGIGTDAYYVLEADPTTGALPVNVTGGTIVVTNPAVGPTGSAVPTSADYQGLNNGGTFIGAVGDSSGRTIVAGAGTAGVSTGGVLSIQGVGSGTAVPVSGTVAATQSGTWTVQPGNTANTTPWLATVSQGGNSATVSAGGALKVDASASTQPVSGTVAVTQSTSPWVVAGGGAAGTAASGVVTVQGITSMTPLLVNGSGSTQPVSGTVTANQGTANATPWTATGTGTAGSAATGVLTVQGITSMTPLLVNGSGSTQPVSGTVAVSNLPSTVDTNSGAAGASTLRVVQSTRSEAAATPLSVRQSNGTSFADYGSGALATTTLRVVSATDNPAGAGRAYADSVRYTYVTAAVGTVSWVQLIASTAALINCIELFDSSGQTLELGTGGAGSETRVLIIPPGGLDGCVPLKIAASTRIAIRALSATTGAIGEINITGFN